MIEFINNNYQVISTVFGLCAALFIGFRVCGALLAKYAEFIRREQRNEFQAGYFDVQEARYNRLLDAYIELSDRVKVIEEKARS